MQQLAAVDGIGSELLVRVQPRAGLVVEHEQSRTVRRAIDAVDAAAKRDRAVGELDNDRLFVAHPERQLDGCRNDAVFNGAVFVRVEKAFQIAADAASRETPHYRFAGESGLLCLVAKLRADLQQSRAF